MAAGLHSSEENYTFHLFTLYPVLDLPSEIDNMYNRGVQTFHMESHILKRRRHEGSQFGDDLVPSFNPVLV